MLASRIHSLPGIVRVAVDGPPATEPAAFAAALVGPLRLLGRPVEVVRAEAFWRDRSLRFEYGRDDVESYRHWLDANALRREVLDAVADGEILPSLRDPVTNRSTHEPGRTLTPTSVVIVCGAFLLDPAAELPFDLTVALTIAPAALRRQTPRAEQWTLPAFDGYAPDADVAVKLDDPRHPALRS